MTKAKEHKETTLIEGERYTFKAAFEGRGAIHKENYEDKPIVWLDDLREAETGEKINPRVWVSDNKVWNDVDPKKGDILEFDARYSPIGKDKYYFYTLERITYLNNIKKSA